VFKKTKNDENKAQRKKVVVKPLSKFQSRRTTKKRVPCIAPASKTTTLIRLGGMNVRVKGKITLNIGGIVSDSPLSKEEIRSDKKELDAFLGSMTQEQRAFGHVFAKKLHEKMKGSSNYTRRVEKVVVNGKVVGSLKGLTAIS